MLQRVRGKVEYQEGVGESVRKSDTAGARSCSWGELGKCDIWEHLSDNFVTLRCHFCHSVFHPVPLLSLPAAIQKHYRAHEPMHASTSPLCAITLLLMLARPWLVSPAHLGTGPTSHTPRQREPRAQELSLCLEPRSPVLRFFLLLQPTSLAREHEHEHEHTYNPTCLPSL